MREAPAFRRGECHYPRFGYKTHAFGSCAFKVHTKALPTSDLDTRKPTSADLPVLRQLWLHEEGAVDFAIDPGDFLIDWLSPNPGITSLVYLCGEEVVGYTRIHRDEGFSPGAFYARDHEIAQKMAQHIGSGSPLDLPLHPSSASAGAFPDAQVETKTWEPAMAFPLAPSPFDEYYQQVEAGTRLSGRPIWHVTFEIA